MSDEQALRAAAVSLPADLDAALMACDLAGVSLVRPPDRPDALHLRDGWAGLPPHHRDILRHHRPALDALLNAQPRPDPDPVWFVRRNLDVIEVPAGLLSPGQRHVWRSGRVYHRLTPLVLAYLEAAAVARYPAGNSAVVAAAAPLSDYCARHFRGDQWGRAFASPPAVLPEPACPAP